MVKKIMDQIQISDSSPDKMYSSKIQDPTNEVLSKKKARPFENRNSTKKVSYGLSNMRSDHQNSLDSSSRQN